MKNGLALAQTFCHKWHSGQTRKYTGEPYWVHPFAVAEMVSWVGCPENAVIAAYLHDVIEDTEATGDDIEGIFGPDVRSLVEQVTDVSRPGDGNRAARKKIDLEHLALGDPDAKTIKLADLIDNTRTIVKHDPKFAKTYLMEKLALMEVLRDGNPVLWTTAHYLTVQNMTQLCKGEFWI